MEILFLFLIISHQLCNCIECAEKKKEIGHQQRATNLQFLSAVTTINQPQADQRYGENIGNIKQVGGEITINP
jgi:hypothetical protein